MFLFDIEKLELQTGYRDMAGDNDRKREAVTWCESLLNDGNLGALRSNANLLA